MSWEYIDCWSQYDPKHSKEEKRALQERSEAAWEEFADYEGLGGKDGIFSREIYRYLRESEELWDEMESI
ncbi:hypothetical protein [Rossellomorea marisflavi]|uniref:hypothetical protein n=1 Tax=Rossellomorea marisflavi TaxID=189381 RepID=UPI00064E397A|nr:hypothetical protein [Rossellomorea marisflavi]KML03203.1 hypothetical protein VL06_16360 [Rossellomorea marisflavi]